MERQQTERGEVVLVEDERNKVSEDSAVAVRSRTCGCHASWSTSAVVTVGDVCGPEKDVFVLQLS